MGYNRYADYCLTDISPLEWAGIFRYFSLTITDRFHVSIFSLKNGVPVVAVDWDSDRIGVATPPMEIENGWLVLYYGVKQTSAGPLIRIGTAILERDNPSSVISRTNIPILSPREEYERIGDVPNIVYTCGAICESDLVKLYYGAANSCICVGIVGINDLVNACFKSESEF